MTEESEAATPVDSTSNKNKTVTEEEKEYELKVNNDTYKLLIKSKKDEKICFSLRLTNEISYYYYRHDYEYEEITKILFLIKEHYDNIKKVFTFYDKAVKNNQVALCKDEKNKKE